MFSMEQTVNDDVHGVPPLSSNYNMFASHKGDWLERRGDRGLDKTQAGFARDVRAAVDVFLVW